MLKHYIPDLSDRDITDTSKQLKCMADDVVDAVCLAVSTGLVSEGKYFTVPPVPMADSTGIFMQLIVPKPDENGNR